MSVLTPKADILGGHEKGLLLTQSGRSLNYEKQWVEPKTNGFTDTVLEPLLSPKSSLDVERIRQLKAEGMGGDSHQKRNG